MCKMATVYSVGEHDEPSFDCSPADPIVLACQQLVDRRFWQIKAENERLRTSVHLTRFSYPHLMSLVKHWNRKIVKCTCANCYYSHRYPIGVGFALNRPEGAEECQLAARFMQILGKCHLSYSKAEYQDFSLDNDNMLGGYMICTSRPTHFVMSNLTASIWGLGNLVFSGNQAKFRLSIESVFHTITEELKE
jgi:hypothetical protein